MITRGNTEATIQPSLIAAINPILILHQPELEIKKVLSLITHQKTKQLVVQSIPVPPPVLITGQVAHGGGHSSAKIDSNFFNNSSLHSASDIAAWLIFFVLSITAAVGYAYLIPGIDADTALLMGEATAFLLILLLLAIKKALKKN
jgi:hypothetical protein